MVGIVSGLDTKCLPIPSFYVLESNILNLKVRLLGLPFLPEGEMRLVQLLTKRVNLNLIS
jgi:hypothetical protein